MTEIKPLIPYVIGILIASLILGGLIYIANQPIQKELEKEYRVFGHNEERYSVSTSQGIFLFQTEAEWNSFELNHTYACDEIYSGISLANCTEIRKEQEKEV